MLKSFVIIFILAFCGGPAFATNSEYQGYTEVDQKIFERVFIRGSAATSSYSDSLSGLFFFDQMNGGFDNLLAKYPISPIEDLGIQNGDPNPFNIILWQVLAGNIAQAMAQNCGMTSILDPARLPSLQPGLKVIVDQLCQWPLPAAQSEEVLSSFFDHMTMYELPYDEYQAWLEFITNSKAKNASDFLYKMSFPLLMNPHYLLKK